MNLLWEQVIFTQVSLLFPNALGGRPRFPRRKRTARRICTFLLSSVAVNKNQTTPKSNGECSDDQPVFGTLLCPRFANEDEESHLRVRRIHIMTSVIVPFHFYRYSQTAEREKKCYEWEKERRERERFYLGFFHRRNVSSLRNTGIELFCIYPT